MRISTSQIFQTGMNNLLDGQGKLYKLQNQLSSGKKFLSAQDDPVAATQVVLTSQLLGINSQYADNQSNAASQLRLEEDRIASVVESVQYIKEQVIAGGNGAYSDSQREYIAQNLQSQFDFMMGMANSADANGYYLFSGYQGHTKPFQQLANGSVTYAGDDGQRLLQVGASRQIAVSDSGRDIFERIRTGNGVFSLSSSASNTGTGVIGSSSVNNQLAWTGNKYEIRFTSPTEYDVYNTTGTPTQISTGNTYTPGVDITDVPAGTGVPGVSFAIGGQPAVGDTFSIDPSTDQSVFVTLQNLITAFSTDIANNPMEATRARNSIATEMVNLERVLENMSSTQASIGSRRSELASLTEVSSALDLHYQERLSEMQDLDYAEAISSFIQQQTQLEAAQSSFAKVTSLSLFNYL